MNKKLTAFFSNYGMSVNGNSAYGTVNGYETNANFNNFDNISPVFNYFDNASPVRIHISFYATDEQKRNMEAAIRNLAIKFFKMKFTPYGLFMGFNDMTLGLLLKRLPEVLDKIYGILSENGALTSGFCPVCGNPIDVTNSEKRNIDGFGITIDNDCVTTINKVISEENQDFNQAPNNYLKGFLGAVIGGVAGAAIAIALYLAGFVSSLSAIVSIVLGAFLYRKFHGKPNKMMIVIVSLTTLAFMIASVFGIYIVAAGIAAQSEGLSMSAFEAFGICMKDKELAGYFYRDLMLIILFTVIGMVLQIIVLLREIKRKKNI